MSSQRQKKRYQYTGSGVSGYLCMYDDAEAEPIGRRVSFIFISAPSRSG